MKLFLIIAIFTIATKITYGQSWSYTSGDNPFDGEYKTASVIGKGGKSPYTEPVFVINVFEDSSLNIYFTEAGYAGCDNKSAFLKLDDDEQIYTFKVTTNSDKDSWFLHRKIGAEPGNIKLIELLEKLKSHSNLTVRLRSDCGQSDYSFSLSGSSAAINYVTSDYLVKAKQDQTEAEQKQKDATELRMKIEETKKIAEELLSTGEVLKANIRYLAPLYYQHNVSETKTIIIKYQGEELKEGKEIHIANCPTNKDYFVLKQGLPEMPPDTVLYVKKYAVDLSSAETIE